MRRMNMALPFITFVLPFLLAMAGLGSTADDRYRIGNLQIEIIKRVENCQMKSMYGDVLHMHHTFSRNDEVLFTTHLLNDPLTFTLVPKSWDSPLAYPLRHQGWLKGMVGMCEGEIRKLKFDSNSELNDILSGTGLAPTPYMVLEVELLKIDRKCEL